MKYFKVASTSLSLAAFMFFSGCATVPLESQDATAKAKSFNLPAEGTSGLYIFRDSILGSALKKDIWVNDKCIGASAPKVFFYENVKGDTDHTISTESEFSPNDLMLKTQSGKNYFVRQYIKMGVFVGGANLEIVSEEDGKKAIADLDMASKGTCGH